MLSDQIIIEKMQNGNYRITHAPHGSWIYEQAQHAISQVRTQLNLLRLPAERKEESKLGHAKFCQCSMCV